MFANPMLGSTSNIWQRAAGLRCVAQCTQAECNSLNRPKLLVPRTARWRHPGLLQATVVDLRISRRAQHRRPRAALGAAAAGQVLERCSKPPEPNLRLGLAALAAALATLARPQSGHSPLLQKQTPRRPLRLGPNHCSQSLPPRPRSPHVLPGPPRWPIHLQTWHRGRSACRGSQWRKYENTATNIM